MFGPLQRRLRLREERLSAERKTDYTRNPTSFSLAMHESFPAPPVVAIECGRGSSTVPSDALWPPKELLRRDDPD